MFGFPCCCGGSTGTGGGPCSGYNPNSLIFHYQAFQYYPFGDPRTAFFDGPFTVNLMPVSSAVLPPNGGYDSGWVAFPISNPSACNYHRYQVACGFPATNIPGAGPVLLCTFSTTPSPAGVSACGPTTNSPSNDPTAPFFTHYAIGGGQNVQGYLTPGP